MNHTFAPPTTVRLDWNVPSTNHSTASDPDTLEGSGGILEVKHFDSLYNNDGDLIVLPAGKQYRNSRQSQDAYESALVVTKYWSRSNKVEDKRIEIKSPHMKAALKASVPAYEHIETGLQHIVIKGEPRCLFHHRDELQAYGMTMEEAGDLEGARHIHFLLSYMWEEFVPESIAFFSCVIFPVEALPSLEFDYLWMVFRPGEVVFVHQRKGNNNSQDVAFMLSSMKRHGGYKWEVDGYRIEYGEGVFGYTEHSYSIAHYNGLKPICHLELVPLQFVSNSQGVQRRLQARGKVYTEMKGEHHRRYDGIARYAHKEKLYDEYYEMNRHQIKYRPVKVRGRIMVDADAFAEANPAELKTFVRSKKVFHANDEGTAKMTDDELMICSEAVRGYSFKDNEWGQFYIDNISDNDLDSGAFEGLILQPEYKQQILSLVQVHEDERLGFDDLIKGKGKGVVFLFYGEPGTGKTLTAESIADYCHKPLLRLDAGVLGTTVESVENQLSAAFRIAERWHAVVLLDEADVFLEQRRSTHLVHNGLVSGELAHNISDGIQRPQGGVFLRMLEYYQGILLLTTNRIGAFDAAFKSRIHLAIRYPPLSQQSRRSLWRTFLLKASAGSFEELDANGVLDRLAAEELNGRQIRNLVRTASAIAIGDERGVGFISERHIKMALGPMKIFADELEREGSSNAGNRDMEGHQRPAKRRLIG